MSKSRETSVSANEIRYYLYEETIDEGSGQAMERLHSNEALSYAEAAQLLSANPRYEGIDCWDGNQWHYDVTAEVTGIA